MTHIFENFIAGQLGTRHPPPPHNNLSEALRLPDHFHDNCRDQEATDDRWVAFIIGRGKLSTEMCETADWLEKIKFGCTCLIDMIVISGVKDFDWRAGRHRYWMNRPRDREEVEYAAVYEQISGEPGTESNLIPIINDDEYSHDLLTRGTEITNPIDVD